MSPFDDPGDLRVAIIKRAIDVQQPVLLDLAGMAVAVVGEPQRRSDVAPQLAARAVGELRIRGYREETRTLAVVTVDGSGLGVEYEVPIVGGWGPRAGPPTADSSISRATRRRRPP
jgi:hypothetical protein